MQHRLTILASPRAIPSSKYEIGMFSKAHDGAAMSKVLPPRVFDDATELGDSSDSGAGTTESTGPEAIKRVSITEPSGHAVTRRMSSAVAQRFRRKHSRPAVEVQPPTFDALELFERCNSDSDGQLTRSDFPALLRLVLDAEKEPLFFDEMSKEQIDDEWDAGGCSSDASRPMSQQMFHAWLRQFRSRYLVERRLLRTLHISCAHNHPLNPQYSTRSY